MLTSRGKLAVAYNKLASYARLRNEARKRANVQQSMLGSLAAHSDRALLRMRYLQLARHAHNKAQQREAQRRQRLNLQSAELLLGTTQTSFMRIYYRRWLGRLTAKEERKQHRYAAEVLLNATTKGQMRAAMRRWQEYAQHQKEARKRAARRDTVLHALSAHSKLAMYHRVYNKLVAYMVGRREEGFYWRHHSAVQRVGQCLCKLTDRGVLAHYYSMLRRYCSSRGGVGRGRSSETLSHLLQSQTEQGLARLYFRKLLAFMKAMQRMDARDSTAAALLSGTHRTMLLRSLLLLAAYAVRGRHRHTRMIRAAGVFPLRLVAGGAPEAVLPRNYSSPEAPPRHKDRRNRGQPHSIPPPSLSATPDRPHRRSRMG